MHAFEYVRPHSLLEAKQLLTADSEATLLAGGMTLLPTLKMRLAEPSKLIDMAGIAELSGVGGAGNTVEIGAMTTHAAVARDTVLQTKLPALAKLAAGIGDAQVRNRGTLGGSIANSDPAADYPAAVLALNATIVTDQREIAADTFFVDMFETALEPTEIIVAVRFEIPKRAAYQELPSPASRYAVVGVMVAEYDKTVRLAVTGAASCVFRYEAMEHALRHRFSPSALEGIAVDSSTFNSDMHASAEYRAHLVTVMAARAVAASAND